MRRNRTAGRPACLFNDMASLSPSDHDASPLREVLSASETSTIEAVLLHHELHLLFRDLDGDFHRAIVIDGDCSGRVPVGPSRLAFSPLSQAYLTSFPVAYSLSPTHPASFLRKNCSIQPCGRLACVFLAAGKPMNKRNERGNHSCLA